MTTRVEIWHYASTDPTTYTKMPKVLIDSASVTPDGTSKIATFSGSSSSYGVNLVVKIISDVAVLYKIGAATGTLDALTEPRGFVQAGGQSDLILFTAGQRVALTLAP